MAMGNVGCDTKQKLIDTALELIWKSSYGSVSVDDICKAADVKKGSFYHFFPSKVDLALAAMEETVSSFKAAHDEIFSAGRDPVARFERYADFVCEGQSEAASKYGHVCGCPSASLGSEMACQEERIRQKFDEITSHKKRYFESTLRDMIADGILPATTDVKCKAEEIYAYVMGQLMMARIQNNLEPLKRDLKQGLLHLLGVTKKAAA
jgi:TetR/AcrR family transcriptional repressor of nem operon